MNDQFLGGMCRRSKNSFERKQQEYRRRARDARQKLLRGMEIVVKGIESPSKCTSIYMRRSPSRNCVPQWPIAANQTGWKCTATPTNSMLASVISNATSLAFSNCHLKRSPAPNPCSPH